VRGILTLPLSSPFSEGPTVFKAYCPRCGEYSNATHSKYTIANWKHWHVCEPEEYREVVYLDELPEDFEGIINVEDLPPLPWFAEYA
jgi:hypothetical protein